MSRLTYSELIEKHINILKKLEYPTGLFSASKKHGSTGYDKSWLRDNFYETLAFEVLGDWETVEKTSKALLAIFLKHEHKIDQAIAHKPQATYEYIHARFHPETFDEFWEEWGNKQNDAVGCILFRLGELCVLHNSEILEGVNEVRIVNKLVKYLESIEYWHDRDSGMWEEDEEVHSSSVGACVAGLKSIERVSSIVIPEDLIAKGEKSLNFLLPRESARKFVDLSLLSLIWPYGVITAAEQTQILENVEYHLLRERGIIRYKGDRYYNKNIDGVSEEAEWTFGLSWLAIIYQKLDNLEKAEDLLKEQIAVDTKEGMPELYFSHSSEYNQNTPLGWSESLFIVALWEMNERLEKAG